jgi:UDP-glucose 4-epimerase
MRQSLVFGGNGFLGNSIVKLSDEDQNFIGVARKQNFTSNYILSDYSYKSLKELIRIVQPQVIFYSLGSSTVGTSFATSDLVTSVSYYETLLQVISDMESETRVFYFSSSAVYGDQSVYFLNEKLTPNPSSPYGENKFKGEELTNKYIENFQINAYNLRIFSTFGARQKRHLIWDVFEKFKSGKDFNLEGDGEQIRDFLHADELASLVVKLASLQNLKNDKAINVASGCPRKISEVVHAISEIFSKQNSNTGSPNFTFSNSETPGKPINLASDVTYLKELVGYQIFAEFNFESRLEETLKQWISN